LDQENNILNYRTLIRHRFIGRVYIGVELKVVKELGNISCKAFWDNANVGLTIKLRGNPKAFDTKLSPKGFSGWNNYPCMVISQKMSENEMGYRGSKSVFLNPQPKEISVKEQRVDGSYFGSVSIPRLRCTLTGGVSCYQFKILSKQLNRSPFSTLTSKPKLNP
jgi:hypothetical protein